MSGKRQYWSKMNHSEAKSVTETMTDDEAGRWFRGWLEGALGGELQDSTKMESRMGFAAGKQSFQDAQEYSKKQAERVSKRYTESTAVEFGSENPTESTAVYHGAPRNTNNKQTNKQTNKENKNKEQEPPAPSRDEWNNHAAQAFPWWPRFDVDRGWDYWQDRGFVREGKTKRSDWKRLMGTWAGKWGEQHPREVAAASAPRIQNGMNLLPADFRPMGKAVEV